MKCCKIRIVRFLTGWLVHSVGRFDLIFGFLSGFGSFQYFNATCAAWERFVLLFIFDSNLVRCRGLRLTLYGVELRSSRSNAVDPRFIRKSEGRETGSFTTECCSLVWYQKCIPLRINDSLRTFGKRNKWVHRVTKCAGLAQTIWIRHLGCRQNLGSLRIRFHILCLSRSIGNFAFFSCSLVAYISVSCFGEFCSACSSRSRDHVR